MDFPAEEERWQMGLTRLQLGISNLNQSHQKGYALMAAMLSRGTAISDTRKRESTGRRPEAEGEWHQKD